MRVELVKNNVPDLPLYIAKGSAGSDTLVECELHIHDEVEILLTVKGKKQVVAGGESLTILPGDAVLINRRVPHSTRDLVPFTSTDMIQFRVEKLHSHEFEYMNRYLSLLISDEERQVMHIKAGTEPAKEIGRYIRLMCEEEKERKKNYKNFISGYMELLLGILYRYNILEDVRASYNVDDIRKIWPVLEYINKNYNRRLELDDLCGVLNMNKHYFCRLFKKATNTTPTEYVNFVRIWKAENLLTTTKQSVLEISMEVGFSSVSYFNRIFKKMKHTNPTTYRSILYAKNKIM